MARDFGYGVLDVATDIGIAVSETVETRVLIRHGSAEERLQVVVVLGRRFVGGEIGDCCVEFGDRVVEQLHAVLECALVACVQVGDFATDGGGVGGGGFDLDDGLVDRG